MAKKFDKATDARRRAREAVPVIPGKKVIPDKRDKQENLCTCDRPQLVCPIHDIFDYYGDLDDLLID